MSRVFVVLEENHSFRSVIGSPDMPFLNGLVPQGALAMQYFANAHPSLPNYLMLTAGQAIASDDSFSGVVTQDNVVRELTAAGKSWKSYAESLPSVGYLGPNAGGYAREHNPFAFLTDVLNDASQSANLVPFSQFFADLASDRVPDYAFIVPDLQNDAHDCPGGVASCPDSQRLAAADKWLKTNIGPVLTSSAFTQDGLLIILFDESFSDDTANGGGHVPLLILSPKAKAGFQSSTFYQHQSTLRLTLEALGIQNWPGMAANAPGMGEFFK
ncbi:MAG TPA: alkaline phosphatase family protein [Terriglobales bacterium]|nr:alkaline phosphatase family protein [Terriglobales bacterium]